MGARENGFANRGIGGEHRRREPCTVCGTLWTVSEESMFDGAPHRCLTCRASHGRKDAIGDPTKLMLHLIPDSALRALGRSLTYGATKYAAHNWRKGLPWDEVYGALLRHLSAWHDGEATDPESGLSHLDHAMACLAFLVEYQAYPETYGKHDTRWPQVMVTKEG